MFNKIFSKSPSGRTVRHDIRPEMPLEQHLSQAQKALQKLRNVAPGDTEAFPLLNEATRMVQQLEGLVAKLPHDDMRDIWRAQLDELQSELKSLTERVLNTYTGTPARSSRGPVNAVASATAPKPPRKPSPTPPNRSRQPSPPSQPASPAQHVDVPEDVALFDDMDLFSGLSIAEGIDSPPSSAPFAPQPALAPIQPSSRLKTSTTPSTQPSKPSASAPPPHPVAPHPPPPFLSVPTPSVHSDTAATAPSSPSSTHPGSPTFSTCSNISAAPSATASSHTHPSSPRLGSGVRAPLDENWFTSLSLDAEPSGTEEAKADAAEDSQPVQPATSSELPAEAETSTNPELPSTVGTVNATATHPPIPTSTELEPAALDCPSTSAKTSATTSTATPASPSAPALVHASAQPTVPADSAPVESATSANSPARVPAWTLPAKPAASAFKAPPVGKKAKKKTSRVKVGYAKASEDEDELPLEFASLSLSTSGGMEASHSGSMDIPSGPSDISSSALARSASGSQEPLDADEFLSSMTVGSSSLPKQDSEANGPAEAGNSQTWPGPSAEGAVAGHTSPESSTQLPSGMDDDQSASPRHDKADDVTDHGLIGTRASGNTAHMDDVAESHAESYQHSGMADATAISTQEQVSGTDEALDPPMSLQLDGTPPATTLEDADPSRISTALPEQGRDVDGANAAVNETSKTSTRAVHGATRQEGASEPVSGQDLTADVDDKNADGEDAETAGEEVDEPAAQNGKDGFEFPDDDAVKAFFSELTGEVSSRAAAAQEQVGSWLAAAGAAVKRKLESEQLMCKERRAAMAELSKASSGISSLEAEQVVAVEAEDFERADELNTDLEAFMRQQQELQQQVKELDEEIATVSTSRIQLVAQQAQLHELLSDFLESLCEDRRSAAGRLQQEAARLRQEADSAREAAEGRVEVMRARISTRHKVLEEEQSQLEEKIAAVTKPAMEEREQLEAEHSRLQAEVEELERRLAAKKAELQASQTSIDAVDQRVRALASKFDKRAADMEAEKAELAADEDTLHKEMEALQKLQEEAATEQLEFDGRHNHLLAEAEELLSAVSKARAEASSIRECISDEAGVKEQLAQLRAASLEAEDKLQELVKCVEELKTQVLELVAQCAHLGAVRAAAEKKVAEAQMRIPEIEADKKAAAAKKDFKEAARLSAESKAVAARAAVLAAEAKQAAGELEHLEAQQAELSAQLEELESMLAEAGRDAGLARWRCLDFSIKHNRQRLETAVENEQYDEADLLQADIDADVREAEALVLQWSLTRKEQGLREEETLDTIEASADAV